MFDVLEKILSNILSRLPVKSLLRFRCVSKSWFALRDSPDFIQIHLKQSMKENSNLNLSLILKDYEPYYVDLYSLDTATPAKELGHHPLKADKCRTHVLGSCNGLLCLSNTEEKIVILNLKTRKYWKLFVEPIELPEVFFQHINYGFGYDFSPDDYKLLRMVNFYSCDDSFDYEVKVYSSKSNTWRNVEDCPYYISSSRDSGRYVGGALHWIASMTPNCRMTNLIAAFDLGTEEYQLVDQPEILENIFYKTMGVFGGDLCVIYEYQYLVNVWVMEEYGVKESWTKLIFVVKPNNFMT